MKNHGLLDFKDENEKDLYLTVLGKHINYIIRRIKHQKLNFLCLKKWEEYIQSEGYLQLAEEATALSFRVEEMQKS